MTAQFTEKLQYKGEELSLRTEPLDKYLAKLKNKPIFHDMSSACWRNYVGKWDIAYDRLYLIGIDAWYVDGTEVTLGTLFPGAKDYVFAKWYTGVLNVAQGKMLHYVHMGYESVFESDLLISVKNGVVVKTEVHNNSYTATEKDLLP